MLKYKYWLMGLDFDFDPNPSLSSKLDFLLQLHSGCTLIIYNSLKAFSFFIVLFNSKAAYDFLETLPLNLLTDIKTSRFDSLS